MAPFLVRHPILLHRWVLAREKALALVRGAPVSDASWETFVESALCRQDEVAAWLTQDAIQAQRIIELSRELARVIEHVEAIKPSARSWDRLYRFAEAELGLEAQEYLVALMLERNGN